MKRKMFFALSLILVLFSLEAKASTPRTTLQYYSPVSGSTINGDTATLRWTIHSWDEVKEVSIHFLFDVGKTETFTFKGNKAKRHSQTITGLQPNKTYRWFIEVVTDRDSGGFGYPIGFFLSTK
jgi:hypothetical protein